MQLSYEPHTFLSICGIGCCRAWIAIIQDTLGKTELLISIIKEDLDEETCFVYTAVMFGPSVSPAALTTVTLYPQGVVQSRQVDYEVLPDENRQCFKCRTTCYLSGITCACSPDKMVCLYHTQALCFCPHSSLILK